MLIRTISDSVLGMANFVKDVVWGYVCVFVFVCMCVCAGVC